MGDQENNVSFQGAQGNNAQALQGEKPVEQGKGAEVQSEITKGTEHLSETITQEVAKQVQSFTDRLTAHIDKRFQELGKPAQEISSGNQQQQVAQINDPAQIQSIIEAQKVTNIAMQEMDEVGVRVLNNDPEVSMIDQSSEAAYIRSCRKAAEAKIKRLNTPSEGRLAGMAGGQYSGSEDADTLAGELQKIQDGPNPLSPANKQKRKEITAKLNALQK
jgi:hypothetical protein